MPNDVLDLDRFVPYRLSVLANRISNVIARQYSERFGLSIPEWRVMAVLGQTSGLSAREVALRTEMDKGAGEPRRGQSRAG
jgi:DNA-binding MarR family transcriptional regulator